MKRIILPSLATLLCLIVLSLLAPGQATAQCCGMQYDVNVSGLTLACSPITVSANFDGAVTDHTFTANGVYPNLPYVAASLCPNFNWVSLDGGITKIFPGQSIKVYTSNTCCFTVSVKQTNSPCKVTVNIGPPATPC